MTTSTTHTLTPAAVTAIQDAIGVASNPDDAVLALREGVHAALTTRRPRALERRSDDRTYRTNAFTIPDAQWQVLAETLIGRLRALGARDRDVAAAVEWWFRFGPRACDDTAA